MDAADREFEGERVLWVGQPARFPLLDPVGVLLVLVALLALAVGGYAIAALGVPSAVLPSLFVLVVLLGVGARLLYRRSTLRRTRYLLTDRRIVVTAGEVARSALLAQLPPPVVRLREGSTIGTIRFGSTAALSISVPGPGAAPTVLVEVEDAAQVRDLIEQTRLAAP